ncbi:MAG: hypothetical protein HN509_09280 [Halobacteriovoraceae bacterium]|jgi:hypothetical protein|nr:hypothetical protein [Halobacteriovoraceae bacterium]MBT5093047.1 hypothetical protein [Halobacteriovoraceae bacterium]
MEKDFVTWFGDFFSLISDVLLVLIGLAPLIYGLLKFKKVTRLWRFLLPGLIFLGLGLYQIKLYHRSELLLEYKTQWQNQLTLEERDRLDDLIYDYTLFSFYWAPEFRQKAYIRHPGKTPRP